MFVSVSKVEFHGVWENLVYDTDIKEKVCVCVCVCVRARARKSVCA